MDKSERENTTKYACDKIDSFLKQCDYTSAILLSTIYAHIRLRAMYTDWLAPPENEWKETFDKQKGTFSVFIYRCGKSRLFIGEEKTNLDSLRNLRNNIAHESKLWRETTPEDERNIKNLCKFTKKFLRRTTTE